MSNLVYYYNQNATPPEETYIVDKNWVAVYGGIDPDTATPTELAAAGFYAYTETAPPTYNENIFTLDSQFVINGTDATLQYTTVDLPIEQSRRYYELQIAETFASILRPTGTVIAEIRADSGTVPAALLTWRDDMATEALSKIATVAAAADGTALETYIESAAYSTWPTQP